MSGKQLGIIIAVTVVLALSLAWVIERQQVRLFTAEFDRWWDSKYEEGEGEKK